MAAGVRSRIRLRCNLRVKGQGLRVRVAAGVRSRIRLRGERCEATTKNWDPAVPRETWC